MNIFKQTEIISPMYKITTRSKKAERQYYEVLTTRPAISVKLEQLKAAPRNALYAHKLKGKLGGKWSCYLGWDIRIIYEIDDEKREIIVVAAGSHKIYG